MADSTKSGSFDEKALWKACEPMREDGMAISRYLEQLSGLLFLKACNEMGKLTLDVDVDGESLSLPPIYRWEYISGAKDISGKTFEEYSDYGDEDTDLPLLEYDREVDQPSDLSTLELYEEAVEFLKSEDGKLAENAFQQFGSHFNRTSTFDKTVSLIEEMDGWDDFDATNQMFGDAYEYLLQKYADKAEGAGEYFTPRPLIKAMVKATDPNPDDEIIDPAAGTNGFLISSYLHINDKVDLENSINVNIESQFHSTEIRTETYRLGLLNYMLHNVDPSDVEAERRDSLNEARVSGVDEYDVVLANPPFGSNIQDKYSSRSDSSIEMNFLLMMMDMLSDDGKAAIVVPEGILFDSSKKNARKDLLEYFNLDCILTLPENSFQPYANVKANVLFFERDDDGTDEFWYYDARTDFEGIKKSNPLDYDKHLSDFVDNWDSREDSEYYFKVDSEQVDEDNYELHLKKYKEFKYEGHRPPEEIAQDIKEEIHTIEDTLDQLVGDAE